MEIEEVLKNKPFQCSCGRKHDTPLGDVVVKEGALQEIPMLLEKYGIRKPFLFYDENTFAAAGEKVNAVLRKSGIPFSDYCFGKERIAPNEAAVGSAFLHFDQDCDGVLGIGSGVINDICKIVTNKTGKEYISVGTAPSMDGYVSGTSSMEVDGLKVSLDSHSPIAVVADPDILAAAPMRMIQAGIGDMLAKYISICEWRISHLLIGEYYCDTVAKMVKESLKKCVDSAEGIRDRKPEAAAEVMKGLVLAGVAANYAGCSRPVSGMEHYFSHIWDMRSLQFKTPSDFHGIQCSIGTVLTLRVYREIMKMTPDEKKGDAYAEGFDLNDWYGKLRGFLGESAEAMIRGEEKEHKYDVAKHHERLKRICENWGQVQGIIREELPAEEAVLNVLKTIGAPQSPEEIGIPMKDVRTTFTMTKDIRDKYIGSRLLWDMGELDETADRLFG